EDVRRSEQQPEIGGMSAATFLQKRQAISSHGFQVQSQPFLRRRPKGFEDLRRQQLLERGGGCPHLRLRQLLAPLLSRDGRSEAPQSRSPVLLRFARGPVIQGIDQRLADR